MSKEQTFRSEDTGFVPLRRLQPSASLTLRCPAVQQVRFSV
jgi:hypothetical protein